MVAVLAAAAAALGWYAWGRSDGGGSPSARTPTPDEAGVFTPARTWVWAPSKGAHAYTFEMTRNGRVVLHGRTPEPRFELPRSFRFQAGAYRWTVRRVPPAAGGKILSDSSFVLSQATAARSNP